MRSFHSLISAIGIVQACGTQPESYQRDSLDEIDMAPNGIPIPDDTWPESWREAHRYDIEEHDNPDCGTPYGNLYRRRSRLLMEAIARFVPVGSSILDVAAAQGSFTQKLARKGYLVTWNDIRSDLIGYVALKIGEQKVRYAAGNIFEIPRQSFDAVIALEIIEHVAHPDQLLKCLAGFVSPGGHLLLSTPNGKYLRHRGPTFSDCVDPSSFEQKQFLPNADGHIFLLKAVEMRTLLNDAGFEVITIDHFGNPLLAGHCGLRAVHRLFGALPGALLESVLARTPTLIREWVFSSMLVVARRRGNP